jgi:hypothetical protein
MTAITLLLVVTIGVGLANLACTVYIAYKMFQEKGPLHALFGFFCCQLYVFFWGWVNASNLEATDIMLFWSFLVVLGIILQVIVQVIESSGGVLN